MAVLGIGSSLTLIAGIVLLFGGILFLYFTYKKSDSSHVLKEVQAFKVKEGNFVKRKIKNEKGRTKVVARVKIEHLAPIWLRFNDYEPESLKALPEITFESLCSSLGIKSSLPGTEDSSDSLQKKDSELQIEEKKEIAEDGSREGEGNRDGRERKGEREIDETETAERIEEAGTEMREIATGKATGLKETDAGIDAIDADTGTGVEANTAATTEAVRPEIGIETGIEAEKKRETEKKEIKPEKKVEPEKKIGLEKIEPEKTGSEKIESKKIEAGAGAKAGIVKEESKQLEKDLQKTGDISDRKADGKIDDKEKNSRKEIDRSKETETSKDDVLRSGEKETTKYQGQAKQSGQLQQATSSASAGILSDTSLSGPSSVSDSSVSVSNNVAADVRANVGALNSGPGILSSSSDVLNPGVNKNSGIDKSGVAKDRWTEPLLSLYKDCILPYKKIFEQQNALILVYKLLDLLEKHGNCPSVVLKKGDSEESNLVSGVKNQLVKVSLKDHTAHVVRFVLDELKKTYQNPVIHIPRAVTMALAHDIGKIPAFHTGDYNTLDHSMIGELQFASLSEGMDIVWKDQVRTAIREHHLRTSDQFTLILKEADRKARGLEMIRCLKGFRISEFDNWFDLKEFIRKVAVCVNVVQKNKWVAVSINGVVYIRPNALYLIANEYRKEKKVFDPLFMYQSNEASIVQRIVNLMKEAGLVTGLETNYYYKRYRLTTRHSLRPYYVYLVPIRLEGLCMMAEVSVEEIENRKKPTYLALYRIEPAPPVEPTKNH